MAKYRYIIPKNITVQIGEHEKSAARILANYFHCNAKFINTTNISSADINIGGVEWEIKSPRGKGRDNIQKNMREAARQSNNVVIDLRRLKLNNARVLGHIRHFLKNPNTLRRVLVIDKDGKIIVMK